MKNKEKIILKNLIKGKTFEDLNSLIEYIFVVECEFNIIGVEALFEMILDLHNDKLVENEKLLKYQILANNIVLSKNSDKAYDPNSNLTSIYEMVRIICIIFKEYGKAYFSGCLDKSLGIVEVNKNGLKIKHFLYDAELKIGDIVYTGNLNSDNLAVVTDIYTTKLGNLLPYIAYVSTEYVYKFSLGYLDISKISIENLFKDKYVRVYSDKVDYVLKIEIESFIGMMVEFSIGDELLTGFISEYLYFYNDKFDGKVIRRIDYFTKVILKERREVTQEVFDFFQINKTQADFLTYINKKENYKIAFNLFNNLNILIKDNLDKLNLVDEINLYYRPMINFVIANVNLNKHYQKINGVCYSILGYLSQIKKLRDNLLKFLIDKKIDVDIKIVEININGFIKKGFLFDEDLLVGDPVFVNVANNSYVCFIHSVKDIKFYELINKIEYYDSYHITPIKNIEKIVNERSSIEDKVILAKVKSESSVFVFRFNNYIPYVGEMIIHNNERFIVVDEPVAISQDQVELENIISVEY